MTLRPLVTVTVIVYCDKQFAEWANSSLSQQTFAIFIASLFSLWLLHCIAFYFQDPCPPRLPKKWRGGPFRCICPRAPRNLVTPLLPSRWFVDYSRTTINWADSSPGGRFTGRLDFHLEQSAEESDLCCVSSTCRHRQKTFLFSVFFPDIITDNH